MMHLAEWVGVLGISQTATGALVAAIWQGVLLAVVVWVGLRLLPKTPAAVRFAIWFAVFLVVAGLPLVSLWPRATGAGGHAWLTVDSRWCLAIVAVWALASLVRAGSLVVAGFRLRALWKRAEVVKVDALSGMRPTHHDEAVMNGAPGLCWQSIFGKRQAQVCVSDEVDRPSVIGFFAPKILIPRWLLEKLTADELRQICLHETGHLGRADDWMNLVQKIALVVFPLNPALAWVERRLCFERELACDERVLRETGAPKAYAACLAGLAEYRLGRRAGALSIGALGRESELGQRIGRILQGGGGMKATHARLVLGGAMLGLMFGAVELARCPQVVVFSGIRAQGSGIRAQGSAPGSGYRAEAVVFHPVVGATIQRQSTLRNETVKDRLPGSLGGTSKFVGGAPKLVDGRAKVGDGAPGVVTVSTRRRRTAVQNEAGVAQWVVVTSWDAADGSRVVLTTASADGDARQEASQVHPYAAVPVRGGWLVFQL